VNRSTTRSTEEAAVRDLYQQLMRAWNRGSGSGLADLFAEDGHLIGFDGTHLRGRKEIGPFHQRLFDRWLKGSRLVGQVTDVRSLGPEAAVLHAVGGRCCAAGAGPHPSGTRSRPWSPSGRRAATGAWRRSRTRGCAMRPSAYPVAPHRPQPEG
jgi:uncharacterized protein (TIGR02246 family)